MSVKGPPQNKTVGELLDRAAEAIRGSSAVSLWRASDARTQAEELLGEVLGCAVGPGDLCATVGGKRRRRFEAWVDRRVAGEPVALIIGRTEFMGMQLSVRKGVFVPRNSSEHMASMAIARLRPRKAPVHVDLATGTGPVALAVARAVPKASVLGLDIAPIPLKVARSNARRLGIGNVEFLQSDLLANLPPELGGSVDAFTIHPPYVARKRVQTLPREIRAFEPRESLTDRSDDGLGLVRRLAEEAPAWLRRGGWVLVEVSPDLSRSVAGILRRGGLTDVRSHRDSLGATRVLAGRL
ncbi:MAG TPA: peptide chain release factor N(5)-glutamine methyltransferase [Actinomycetota bacterium]